VNVSALANSAYAPSAAGVQSPKEIEYKAFARATGALVAARESRSHTALAKALVDNNRLWTTLAADVASPDNALPQGLRKSIAELAVFTLKHTRQVFMGTAQVDALIEINQAVMKGLRSKTETAA
jgi:flagellar protein FlaF